MTLSQRRERRNPLKTLHLRLLAESARLHAIAEDMGRLDPDKATVFEAADIADRFGLEIEFVLRPRPPPPPKKRKRRSP